MTNSIHAFRTGYVYAPILAILFQMYLHLLTFQANLPPQAYHFRGFHANLSSSSLPLSGFPRKPFLLKSTTFGVSTQTFPPQVYHFRGFHANLSSSSLPLSGFPRKPFFLNSTTFGVSMQTFPPQLYHFRGFHANLSSSTLPLSGFPCKPFL